MWRVPLATGLAKVHETMSASVALQSFMNAKALWSQLPGRREMLDECARPLREVPGFTPAPPVAHAREE
jgi:hypothetical protein